MGPIGVQRKFQMVAEGKFEHILLDIDWSVLGDDLSIDSAFEVFSQKIQEALTQSTITITIGRKTRKRALWASLELVRLASEKSKLYNYESF